MSVSLCVRACFTKMVECWCTLLRESISCCLLSKSWNREQETVEFPFEYGLVTVFIYHDNSTCSCESGQGQDSKQVQSTEGVR